jgi:CubicO group peptidase (beta-lactamase class C family)
LCALCLIAQAACNGGGSDAAAPLPATPVYSYQAPIELGDLWAVEDAAELGVSVEILENMMQAVRRGEYPVIDSIAMAYQGKLILHETVRDELNTFDGWVNNTDLDLHILFSASKSIASILIGMAIDQGVMENVDTPFLSFFAYSAYDNWDDRKNDILLHDVLTMRVGLEWDEWDPPYSDPDNRMLKFYDSHTDFSKGLLDLPLIADPGSVFAYNTVATVALGQAIENTAPLTLIDYSAANLLVPLGISQVELLRTPTGLPDLGRGFYMTSRDFLKFGQLYLDDGQWNGQQLVSSDWVSRSTTPYTEFGWANPQLMDWQIDGYGYQWWIGHFEYQGQEYASFAAWGSGEQWLMVVPGLELVVAINSHGWDWRPDQTNEVLNLIWRFMLPAVTN